MQIIILGAGDVGGTLAAHLSSEKNDVTLIDLDPMRLKELQRKLDIKTVQGFASWPKNLEAAGIVTADMLIAVTDSDEINLVACQIAFACYQTPRRIARIRTDNYLDDYCLFEDEGFAVDVRICPEVLVTSHIAHLIYYPGALQVLSFLTGKLQLVAIKPFYGGLMIDKTIRTIQNLVDSIEWRIVCILRRNRPVQLKENTTVELGDEVYFIAKEENINDLLNKLGRSDCSNKQIMIAGGGNIGLRLCGFLEDHYSVKVIERNLNRSQHLADQLKKSIVLHGHANDRSLLLNENIETCDVFCAVTDDDESNIIACLQAKRLGARQVIALINEKNYIDLVESSLIDVAVSSEDASVSSILRCVRQGDIVQAHSLRHNAAEVIEIVVHGDSNSSSVVGEPVSELSLPKEVNVIAIIRENEIMIHLEQVIIKSDDHVILLVSDKKMIEEIERSFQVKVNFF